MMPVLFIPHSAPFLATDFIKGEDYFRLAQNVPKPKALLVISAHWQTAAPMLGTTESIPLIYDFYGFPEDLYAITYPAPPAPWLAKRIQEVWPEVGIARSRGWDHGVWVPMLHMYPNHDVPILQLALPKVEPAALYALGEKLVFLRNEGILIIGSGNLTHNLMALAPEGYGVPQWAIDFDQWVRSMLEQKDVQSLLLFQEKAPGVEMALPTDEHFLPLFVALGTAGLEADPVFPIEGFEFGSLSRRAVLWH